MTADVLPDFSAEINIKLSSVKLATCSEHKIIFSCGNCSDHSPCPNFEELVLHTLCRHQQNCTLLCGLCSKKFALSKLLAHTKRHSQLSTSDIKNSTNKKEIRTSKRLTRTSPRSRNTEMIDNFPEDKTPPLVSNGEKFCRPFVEADSCILGDSNSVVDCQVTIKVGGTEKSSNLEENATNNKTLGRDLTQGNKTSKLGKIFQCDLCQREFTRKSGLNIHYLVHSKKRPYICSDCGKRFSFRNGLTRHALIHKGEKRHKCAVCGKAFIQSSHLKTHQITHLSGEARLSIPRPKREKKLNYQCNVCPMAFSYKSSLEKHLRTHTGEKPFKCPHCERYFAQKELLSLHEANIHSENKKYECSICHKQFGVKNGLQGHMAIHTGHKPHLCSECGKSFRKLSHLTQHKRLHTGEKPYLCTLCGKAFKQPAHLKTHFKSHEEKLQDCSSRPTSAAT